MSLTTVIFLSIFAHVTRSMEIEDPVAGLPSVGPTLLSLSYSATIIYLRRCPTTNTVYVTNTETIALQLRRKLSLLLSLTLSLTFNASPYIGVRTSQLQSFAKGPNIV